MFTRKLTFNNSRRLKLSAIFEGESKNAPTIVMCHGFGSSKNRILTKKLAEKLVGQSLSVFRFDFTGCGESEGDIKDLTPFAGLDDLKSAVKVLDREKFALLGSSFGGYISLMYSQQNPVLALALKAPVSDYMEIVKESETEKSEKFLNEVEKIEIYKNAPNIKCDTLIVHGDIDEVVPISQSQKLVKLLGGKAGLCAVKGGLHSMRGGPMEKAHNLIADFFQKNLLN